MVSEILGTLQIGWAGTSLQVSHTKLGRSTALTKFEVSYNIDLESWWQSDVCDKYTSMLWVIII